MTPLHVAAKKGDRLELVDYLLDKGADINIKDYSGVSDTTLLNEHQVPYPLFMYVWHDDGQISTKKLLYMESGVLVVVAQWSVNWQLMPEAL